MNVEYKEKSAHENRKEPEPPKDCTENGGKPSREKREE